MSLGSLYPRLIEGAQVFEIAGEKGQFRELERDFRELKRDFRELKRGFRELKHERGSRPQL